MRFQVPQFIDIQDKIFGPFTFRQFVYLLGGGGLAYAFYRFLGVIGLPLSLAALGLAAALTFYKINNKPFIFILQAWVKYITSSRLYVWKPRKPKQEKKKTEKIKKDISIEETRRLTKKRLSDLSWSLDVLDMKESNK